MSYKLQIWVGVKYGLGASLATLKDIEEGLGLAYYYLLNKLGLCRSINTELRYMPSALEGIGLHDLTAETAAATLDLFLQLYKTDCDRSAFNSWLLWRTYN